MERIAGKFNQIVPIVPENIWKCHQRRPFWSQPQRSKWVTKMHRKQNALASRWESISCMHIDVMSILFLRNIRWIRVFISTCIPTFYQGCRVEFAVLNLSFCAKTNASVESQQYLNEPSEMIENSTMQNTFQVSVKKSTLAAHSNYRHDCKHVTMYLNQSRIGLVQDSGWVLTHYDMFTKTNNISNKWLPPCESIITQTPNHVL